ncbi:phage tail tip lysozyme [Nocardia sp. CC227C]|uniref:phage tail tip lysozyme n=1 Tax=Nocardia sp. CC227C TaxID=3044562 RepID=UPI00278BC94B|nr:phage tail tip lysozyme [Nocardia sp. CC227C]
MVVTGQDGTVAHYRGWTVELPHPAGGSAGLDSVIDAAELAIQVSVDLFGSGAGAQAPDLVERFAERGLVDDSGNQSVMADDYASNRDEIDEIATELRRQNKEVDTSAYTTSTKTSAAMSDIDHEVDGLKSTLAAEGPVAGAEHLSMVAEARLLRAILRTVDEVSEIVEEASRGVVEEAERIHYSSPTYGAPYPSMMMNTGGYGGYAPAGSDSGGGGYMQPVSAEGIPGGQHARVDEMYQRLLDNGFTPAQAAGILGNLQVESSFRTDAWNAGESALGLVQWRDDRLEGLRQFAAERDGSVTDWRIQIDYISHELKHGESAAYAHLRNAQTPGEAAAVFDQYYERSDGSERAQRIANANSIASSMTNSISV